MSQIHPKCGLLCLYVLLPNFTWDPGLKGLNKFINKIQTEDGRKGSRKVGVSIKDP